MTREAIATSYLLAILLGQTPKPANDNGTTRKTNSAIL